MPKRLLKSSESEYEQPSARRRVTIVVQDDEEGETIGGRQATSSRGRLAAPSSHEEGIEALPRALLSPTPARVLVPASDDEEEIEALPRALLSPRPARVLVPASDDEEIIEVLPRAGPPLPRAARRAPLTDDEEIIEVLPRAGPSLPRAARRAPLTDGTSSALSDIAIRAHYQSRSTPLDPAVQSVASTTVKKVRNNAPIRLVQLPLGHVKELSRPLQRQSGQLTAVQEGLQETFTQVLEAIRMMVASSSGVAKNPSVENIFSHFENAQMATILLESVPIASLDLLTALFQPDIQIPSSAISMTPNVEPKSEFNVSGLYVHISRLGDTSRGIYVGMGAGETATRIAGFGGLLGIAKRVLASHGSPTYRASNPSTHYSRMYEPADGWEQHVFKVLAWFHPVDLDKTISLVRLPLGASTEEREHMQYQLRRALVGIFEAVIILGAGLYTNATIKSALSKAGYSVPSHPYASNNRSPGLEYAGETLEELQARSSAGGTAASAKRREAGLPSDLTGWLRVMVGPQAVAAMAASGAAARRESNNSRKLQIWQNGGFYQSEFTLRDHPQMSYSHSIDPAVLAFLPLEVRDTRPKVLRLQVAVRGSAAAWIRPPQGTTVWKVDLGSLDKFGLPQASEVVVQPFEILEPHLLKSIGKQHTYLPAEAYSANPSCVRALQRVTGEDVVFSLATSIAWDEDPEVGRRRAHAGQTPWTYKLRFLTFVGWLQYIVAAEKLAMDGE